MQYKTLSSGFIIILFLLIAVIGCGDKQGLSHTHTSVNQETAKLNARLIVVDHVAKNKLEKSWASIDANSAVKNENETKPAWKVTFLNKSIRNSRKQKYYVFLTLDGKYISANFSGK